MIITGPPATETEIIAFVRASTLEVREALTSKDAIARHVAALKATLEADNPPEDLLTKTIHNTLEIEKP